MAAAAIIGYAAIATFPGWYLAAQPGPDPSWLYGLNILPETGYGFGPDLAFTHGPLGRLILPIVPPSSLVVSALIWWIHALVLAAVLTIHHLRSRRLAALAAGVGTLVLALAFGVPYEYQIVLLLGLILMVPPEDRRAWTIAAPVASALAAAFVFVKSTTGLAAGAMLVIAAAWWILRREARPSEVAVRVGVPYILTFFTLGLILIGPPDEIAAWLGLTFQVAAGFANAMTVDGPSGVKLIALAALTVFAGLALAGRRSGTRDLLVPLLFAGPLLLEFRHSFVRHHGKYLAAYLMGIMAISFLVAVSRRRLIHVGIAAGLTVALAIGSSLIEECGCPFQPSVLGVRGIRNVSHTVHLGDVRAKLVATADEELAVNRLPPAWVERIRAAGEVDAIPWELSFVAANGLSWRPNPVIQTYHAYTEGLDQAVADHIANDGPPHLLVQFLDFDGRYPLWSSPEMWIAILSNYELVDTLPFVPGREPVALMARRPEPLELGLERAHAAEAELGEWFAIPERDEAVFASIDLYRDLEGWLASLFWHTDPLLFEFRFEDGRIYTTRMLPGTAGGRHLANYPPLIFEQLVWLLEGKLPPKATAFRIIGPGSESFESRVRVTWWTSTWNPAATADAVP